MRRLVPALAVALVLLLAASCGSAEQSVTGRSSDATTTVPSTTVPSTTDLLPTTPPKDGDGTAPTSGSTVAPGPTSPSSGPPSSAPSTTAAPVTVDACPAVPARRAPDPQRPTYDVTMTADPDSGLVQGSQRVTFTPDLPVDTLVFRLWANGPRPRSVGTSIAVGPVSEVDTATGAGTVRAVDLPDATTLVVRLGRWVSAGETVTVDVPWRLEVGGPVNDRISRQGGSLRLGSFLPLLAWEPGAGWAVEPPTSGFAESTTSTTADWVLRITAPAGFGIVASGVRSGDGRWVASAVRDVAVAVGRFTTVEATARVPDPVQVTVSVHDGIDRADAYLDQLVSHLETFSAWFGPYPWPAYHLSITADLSGGIEFPMHVLQGPGTGGRTTPHEVAHMWFYGLVGNNQARDPWLDEGLATYAEGRIAGTLPSMASSSIPSDGQGRADAPMTYWEGRGSSYYRSVYVQTAAAMSRVGAVSLLDCALAYYVADNAHTVARPEDFARAMDATFVSWRGAMASAGLP